VTAATLFIQWRNLFRQRREDAPTISEVPIKFQRIWPATSLPVTKKRRRAAGNSAQEKPVCSGSLLVTNDYALASAVASFSPDFAEVRPHDFDRTLME
jgi:hypothetical protein